MQRHTLSNTSKIIFPQKKFVFSNGYIFYVPYFVPIPHGDVLVVFHFIPVHTSTDSGDTNFVQYKVCYKHVILLAL
jgi:hypothetical protein